MSQRSSSRLWFTDHRRPPVADGQDLPGTHDPSAFADLADQLEEYFDGRRRQFDLEVAPVGTPWQRRVWQALTTIPYGSTSSYGEIARGLGDPAGAQAVGAANGRNPVSIVLPCHRVVGGDGALVGYAGGLERKRSLLDLERRCGRLF